MNKMSKVKKVIGVVSGKGGVGKSLVTSMMAVTMQRRDQKTAILDADITGPSIPKCFGIHERAQGCEDGLFPVNTKSGINKAVLFSHINSFQAGFKVAATVYNKAYAFIFKRGQKLIPVLIKATVVIVCVGVENITVHLSYL
jgi:hypothetical protein